MRIATLALMLGMCASFAAAQAPDADIGSFEVATVRENTSSETRRRIEVLPGGQFTAMTMTPRELVSIAYPTDGGRFRHADQLVGGPGWFNSARFDIIAKAAGVRGLDTNKPGFTATAADRDATERVRMMLQQLLTERFKLRLHHETRQLPIYDLVLAKSNGELGPQIRRSAGDCMAQWKKEGRPDARNLPCGSIQGRPGGIVGNTVEIGVFARDLYDWSGRAVVDRTGMTGPVDFTLTWAPEGTPDSAAPSLFTALQEQLGLKLSPARGPVDVLVVDSAQRLTPE